jgi:dipeptidyl aminopeptidase/acylaminoacyl peptidase
MGVADAENLFEMGWSYGGYMTSFIITKTDRFNAVSMGAGLPNLISMVNTTDISSYLVGHMGGYYWESEEMEETYERHSAIYRIDEISTPTQIIHGLQDDRVPTSQGREFYWALQERGVPSELILYPRTPHGPREPKFIADVPTRIMSWFKQYMEE